MKPAPRFLPAALAVAAVVALGAVPTAALAAPPPIPQTAADLSGLKLFSGHKATPHPIKAPKIPRHPFMAVNGRNAVHNDAYQSDTYRNSGPLGQRLRVFSQSYDGMGGLGSCGITIAFDKHSRLVTTCISATSVQLRLMKPDLTTVATQALPPRVIPPGVNPFQSPGGAYFYVDNKDRAVVSMGRQIFVIAIRGNSLTRVKTYDLSSVIPADDQLNSALVRHPRARHRRRARPGHRTRARHPPHGRGDRQLVRHGRDRWRLHRH
jgi:hypothetical protein